MTGPARPRRAATPGPADVARLPLRVREPEAERPPLLDVAAVAAYASISEKLVRAEVGRGNLRARRLGRLLRFRMADVDAWLDAATIGGRP